MNTPQYPTRSCARCAFGIHSASCSRVNPIHEPGLLSTLRADEGLWPVRVAGHAVAAMHHNFSLSSYVEQSQPTPSRFGAALQLEEDSGRDDAKAARVWSLASRIAYRRQQHGKYAPPAPLASEQPALSPHRVPPPSLQQPLPPLLQLCCMLCYNSHCRRSSIVQLNYKSRGGVE